jgi:histidinol-phosphatase
LPRPRSGAAQAALDADVRLAHRLADVAAQIALSRFGDGALRARRKPDGSLVSDADLAVDRVLVEILSSQRPQDGVLSEESGTRGADARRRWLLDPIDGTDRYLAGARNWGTHVALEVDGRLVVAIITRPTEWRRWWALRGHGAFESTSGEPLASARRLAVSRTASLRDARVGGLVEPGSSAAAAIARRARWIEHGVSAIAALLDGALDAVLDEGGDVWDQAPAALLVTEAGGVFRDPRGGSRLDLSWGLYSNPQIQRALVDALAGHVPEGPDAAGA